MVAADAYATTLFGMKPADIDYIRLGAEMGLGKMDLKYEDRGDQRFDRRS